MCSTEDPLYEPLRLRMGKMVLRLITFIVVTFVFILGCIPFVQTILGYNGGEEFPRPLEPACQNKCELRVPRSSVDKFNSFSLDSTQALFVHFSGYNLSLKPSDTGDILDPLNLVWVESSEAPFLSWNLGFKVYSFRTLSRVVHRMEFKVQFEKFICLQNMSHSCVTANLARVFLGNVTKAKGVLCYAVNDSNTVNYRCCKGNPETQRVECDIPAVLSPEMAIIFTIIAVATLIGILCFPAFVNIFPDEEKFDTLSANIQVHHPLYHFVILAWQALKDYSNENYCVNVFRKLLIGLVLPVWFYIDLGLQWHTITYDMPKMFNDRVKEHWVTSKTVYNYLNSIGIMASHLDIFKSHFMILGVYWFWLAYFCIIPTTETDATDEQLNTIREKTRDLIKEEEDIKINWWKPSYDWTKHCWLTVKFLFEIGTAARNNEERSWFLRPVALLGGFLLMLLTLAFTLVFLVVYAWFVSPLKKMLCLFVYYFILHFYLVTGSYRRLVVLVIFFLTSFFFYFAIQKIFLRSLLLSARLVVYLWMGLIASRDYYFPRVAAFSVLAYYCWNCTSVVKKKYQILLIQTVAKCKEYQENHPSGRETLLTFDENEVPRISHELFKRVINEILPKSVVYTKMILKLTTIILFLSLTFSSILVYGSSNLNQSTQALAVFLTGLLPKLFEVFGEGSSYQQLCEMENSYQIEKIINDFLNSNTETTIGHDDEQQPTNNLGDQLSSTNINHAIELDQLIPEESERPIPSSRDADNITSIA